MPTSKIIINPILGAILPLKIYTGAEDWKDVNDYSVVCRLDTGDVEFLFMGDAETHAEKALKDDISAEILRSASRIYFFTVQDS